METNCSNKPIPKIREVLALRKLHSLNSFSFIFFTYRSTVSLHAFFLCWRPQNVSMQISVLNFKTKVHFSNVLHKRLRDTLAVFLNKFSSKQLIKATLNGHIVGKVMQFWITFFSASIFLPRLRGTKINSMVAVSGLCFFTVLAQIIISSTGT